MMKKIILLSGLMLFLSIITNAQTAVEWNKQGVEHSKKFEYKQAYECFSKAIALDANFAEAYYNRATVWFELPSDTFPENDGCSDLEKAIKLGFKVKKEKLTSYGCL